MKDIILLVLSGIGALTVGVRMGDILLFLWEKFYDWRKNGCKIKCLCKPHIYEIKWHLSENGETILVCKKCGKKKTMFIDFDSYNEAAEHEDN